MPSFTQKLFIVLHCEALWVSLWVAGCGDRTSFNMNIYCAVSQKLYPSWHWWCVWSVRWLSPCVIRTSGCWTWLSTLSPCQLCCDSCGCLPVVHQSSWGRLAEVPASTVTCVYACVCVYLSVCVCICMCGWSVNVCTERVWMCMRMCACECDCVSVLMHAYIHTHTHAHAHTHSLIRLVFHWG